MKITDLFAPFSDELQLAATPSLANPPLIEWTNALSIFPSSIDQIPIQNLEFEDINLPIFRLNLQLALFRITKSSKPRFYGATSDTKSAKANASKRL